MSAKTRSIQRVFVFLLLSVGILFTVLLLRTGPIRSMTARLLEPFQTTPTEGAELRQSLQGGCDSAKSACRQYQFQQNTFWLCEDGADGATGYDRAEQIITQCRDGPFFPMAPGYTSLIQANDTACYMSENSASGSNFFVCFQRPAPKFYDTDLQAYVDSPPAFDPAPEDMARQLPAVCGAYQASVGMILRTFSTTSVNYNKVNSAIQTMSNAYSTIMRISTINCSRPNQNSAQSNACAALNGFLTTYNVSPQAGGSNLSTLFTIRNRMSNALINLQSTFTDQIKPQFNGFRCPFPALSTPPGFIV